MTGRLRVCNVITKFGYGGAQETVLGAAKQLAGECEFFILTGPEEPDLIAEAENAGAKVHVLRSMAHGINLIHDINTVFAIRNFLREHDIEVVHTHSSKAGVVGRLAARLARVPSIHTVHGWSFHERMNPLLGACAVAVEGALAQFTAVIVVVADADREKGLRRRIGSPEQYRLIRSAIDIARFTQASVPAHDDVVVGFVGRLARQKAPLDFVSAASELPEHLRFEMYGDGPLQAQVKGAIGAVGLTDRMTMYGPRRDIESVLPAFDVFVLSSLWEGLPRVVVEALAAGVAVVATDVGGVREIVENQVSGLLVPPGDAHALAVAIERMISDKALAKRCREEGVKRAAAFDVSEMGNKLMAEYQRVGRK